MNSTLRPKVLIFIGTAQSGKSAFCSFLKEGKEWQCAAFPVGNGIAPKTVDPRYFDIVWEYLKLSQNPQDPDPVVDVGIIRILDTPGIGDVCEAAEERNMLKLYTMLTEMAENQLEIAGVVLVVKFPTLLTEEFFEKLEQYKKLFSGVLNTNFMLVVTAVEQNEGWTKKYLRATGNEVGDVIAQLQASVLAKMANVIGDFPIFTVDSLCLSGSVEEKHAQEVRQVLFNRCFEVPTRTLEMFRFPKLISWLDQDRGKILGLQGRRCGILEGIRVTQSQLELNATELASISAQCDHFNAQVVQVRARLAEINSDAWFAIYSQPMYDSWHLVRRAHSDFDVKTDYTITAKVVSQGWAVYSIDDSNHVKGHVNNALWSSLSGCLTLYTSLRIRFAEEIAAEQQRLLNLQSELSNSSSNRNELVGRSGGYQEQLAQYNGILEEISTKIAHLSDEYLTLAGVQTRVAHLTE